MNLRIDSLRQLLEEPTREYPQFGAALMFLGALGLKEDAIKVLERRAAAFEADIAAGRLVAPFAVHHPSAAGWYFVCPDKTLAARKVLLFKQWIMAEAALAQSRLDPEMGG